MVDGVKTHEDQTFKIISASKIVVLCEKETNLHVCVLEQTLSQSTGKLELSRLAFFGGDILGIRY